MTIHRIGLRPSLGQERSRLNKKRRCARNGSPIPRTLSLLPLEGGGAERRRLASLSFVFDQPPALRASPFHRKGVDFYHLYLLPQKGDRWLSPFSLLPMEGGAPKGRRLDGESGMKKSGGDHLKQAIYESTRAPLARSPFLNGEATIREYRFPHNVKANTRICGKRITTDKAFPSRGRCPEGADRALAV